MNQYSREFGRAQRLGVQGRYDSALDVYDTLIEADPEFAAALAYRGQTLERLERFDEAAESMSRAVELEPERFAWRTMLAGVECARGEYEAAHDAAESALELNPQSALARAYAALTRAALGEWQTALDELGSTALPCQPDFQANVYVLVEQRIARMKTGTSLEFDHPDDPPNTPLAHVPIVRGAVAAWYLRLAERAANGERYEDAVRAALRAHSLAPRRFGIDEFFAELYLLAGDVDRADTWLKRAEKRRSDDPIVLYLRGRIYLARHSPSKSVGALDRAVELDHELEEVYYWLGRAHLEADAPGRALGYFRQFALRDAGYLRGRLELIQKLVNETSPAPPPKTA